MTTSEDSEMKDELSGIAIEVHSIGPDGLDLPMEKPSECSGIFSSIKAKCVA